MSDLISRQLCIDALSPMACVGNSIIDKIRSLPSALSEPIKYNIENFNKEDWEQFKKEWRNAPITVLPVQPDIIRCKDCKWHKGRYHCLNFDVFGFNYNDYCSLAERRQNE